MTQMTRQNGQYRMPRPAARRRGFTLVEIVIAFIIIGILTAIMVPTIARRADDAKITAAQADIDALVAGLERVSIDIGHVVRMYALNDVRGGNGTPNTVPLDPVNGLLDNGLTGNGQLYEQPAALFISPITQNFLPAMAQQQLFEKLTDPNAETSYRNPTQWRGPYVNWSRDVNGNDWPDDPWGNDYLFFSRQGMLWPPDPRATSSSSMREDHSWEFNSIGPDIHGNPTALLFDRFTVLSLGPNGLPGDGSGPSSPSGAYGQGDDIYRQFGGY